ncbi:WD40 repeat domain-containing protein [uncultured Methanoregula sp.]|uniref:WD40 repeat domain-containing protein n=1 Tax=uncultured Methanoregula sp. TaxID=1005933 RepID=UPI002AAC3C6C|nr:WD40 repeat domain-containing protein [uncultured Methanoregula sp.]
MKSVWVQLIAAGIVFAACAIGTAAGTSLGSDWTERPVSDDSPFSGVQISADGGTVFAGGNHMLVRSWDGKSHFGGQSGIIAAMSPDGNYVVTALGRSVTLLNNKGEPLWERILPATARAVAISRDGTLIVAADEKGYYSSWARNGDFYGRVTDDPAKKIAISRTGDLVVATTEGGLRFYDGALNVKWADNRSGSIDTYIAISSDGSTVITAGGTRLSSHTSNGTLNWMNDVTKDTIIDMACSEDGSAIIVGGQDNAVTAIDRYGKTHWTYSTGSKWANSVGVSTDASVIAVGASDGTVYVLDHGGSLLAKRSTGGIIQPRSLAVSRDGTRIVVSDQYRLNGLEVIGNTAPEGLVTYTSTPLNPVSRYTTETTIPTVNPVLTLTTTGQTPVTPAATQKSPTGLFVVILAVAGIALVMARGKR